MWESEHFATSCLVAAKSLRVAEVLDSFNHLPEDQKSYEMLRVFSLKKFRGKRIIPIYDWWSY